MCPKKVIQNESHPKKETHVAMTSYQFEKHMPKMSDAISKVTGNRPPANHKENLTKIMVLPMLNKWIAINSNFADRLSLFRNEGSSFIKNVAMQTNNG